MGRLAAERRELGLVDDPGVVLVVLLKDLHEARLVVVGVAVGVCMR